jgi:hypothetical protein
MANLASEMYLEFYVDFNTVVEIITIESSKEGT